jgi:hypothetical protein
MKSRRVAHLALAVGGLLLVGGGLSVFGHAVILKVRAPEAWLTWAAWGTVSLALVNAGICLVVEAGKKG